jgi:hypothetical protein
MHALLVKVWDVKIIRDTRSDIPCKANQRPAQVTLVHDGDGQNTTAQCTITSACEGKDTITYY